MSDILIKLIDGYSILFIIFGIMVISGWVKSKGYFLPVYDWIIRKVKSKRAVVFLISLITGVLPIPGRVAVSAGFLNTIAPNDSRRKIYGIIDYLSTHHYYFWSPLEKTVLVPMAVLSLSYVQFIGIMWPLLAASILVTLFYIFFVLKEDDVVIEVRNEHTNHIHTHTEKWIDWKVLIWTSVVLILGNVIKLYLGEVTDILKATSDFVAVAVLLSFLFAFATGSSGKYAGMVALLSTIFGIKYLPLFTAIDYAGYMLSPVHKCFVVGKTYFQTPVLDYYKAIGFLCGSIFIVAVLATLI
jgi:hypothetical protein